MITVYEIPLSATPQTFSISLGTITYEAVLVWNVPSQCWILGLYTIEGTPVLTNIPLVVGVNLLAQYSHLAFQGELRVQNDSDVEAAPTYEDLGTRSKLYFVVTQ